jgi:c(7)-type cytochrome triheme protein
MPSLYQDLKKRLGPTLRWATIMVMAVGVAACGSETEDTPGEVKSPPQEQQAAGSHKIQSPDGREWYRLSADGLHDPNNKMLQYLQQPAEALGVLPNGGPDGNQVDWIAALREGAIAPRTNVRPETKIRVLDLDITFTETAGQPHVVFPHRQHTEWLDCANCHPKIFVAKRGANDFGMLDVLNGEYCGRCHGAVSFPLTECKRCHNRDWQAGVAN